MSKTYHYAYIDENGTERHMELQTNNSYAAARREFTNECARNGWEFIYFRRAN